MDCLIRTLLARKADFAARKADFAGNNAQKARDSVQNARFAAEKWRQPINCTWYNLFPYWAREIIGPGTIFGGNKKPLMVSQGKDKWCLVVVFIGVRNGGNRPYTNIDTRGTK